MGTKNLNVKVLRYILANLDDCVDVAIGMFCPRGEREMHALIRCVYHEANPETLRDFLTVMEEEDVNVNHQDENGKTALIRASQRGDLHVVKLLLQDEEIDVSICDKNKSTALMHAKREGHMKIVELLQTAQSLQVTMHKYHLIKSFYK